MTEKIIIPEQDSLLNSVVSAFANIIIIVISNLSNDRSKASSKTIPPHSAI